MGRKSILNLTERQLKVLHQHFSIGSIFARASTKKIASDNDIHHLLLELSCFDDYIKNNIINVINKIVNYFITREIDLLNNDKSIITELIKEIKKSVYYKKLDLKEKKKITKELDKAKNELYKRKPKGKKTEDLAKHYIDTALRNNDIPTVRQLQSEIYSSVSYSRILKTLNFNFLLLQSIGKRLNNKKLSKSKKDLLIELENHTKIRIQKFQNNENKKTGLTSKSKPDYNDNINYEVKNIFDDLKQD